MFLQPLESATKPQTCPRNFQGSLTQTGDMVTTMDGRMLQLKEHGQAA